MRFVIIAVLVMATLWDMFSTLYGTLSVFEEGIVQTIASILFTILVLSFLLSTRKIMQARQSRGGFVAGILILFWLIAIFFDLYTSWIGNQIIVIQDASGFSAYMILFGLTLLSTSAPILLSVLWSWAMEAYQSSDNRSDVAHSERPLSS